MGTRCHFLHVGQMTHKCCLPHLLICPTHSEPFRQARKHPHGETKPCHIGKADTRKISGSGLGTY